MNCLEENRYSHDQLLHHEEKIKRLEKDRERYELAINGASEGLWDWNLITNEVYFAPRWKMMLGYEDHELLNELETWAALVHPEDLEGAEKAIEMAIETKIPYENIHRLRHKEGYYIWNLDRGQVIYEGERAVRMIGFHTDITRERQMTEEIRHTQELMIAQSRHAAMGEMIGMIAHQWRQPLSIISMVVNNMMIDIELGELDPASCRVSGEEIESQINYLSKTIEDFRDFFRPDKECEEIRVADVLNEAYAMMNASFNHHGIVLSIIDHSHETVFIHSRELLQVLINILKNAKEAMMMNEVIEKNIDVLIEDDGDSVVIRICDSGGGVSDEILPLVFDPYFSTKDEKTGTGLGLYMSKTIIEKHLKGTISVHNSPKGACFTIRLPKTSSRH